jgi:hypothetical protein
MRFPTKELARPPVTINGELLFSHFPQATRLGNDLGNNKF